MCVCAALSLSFLFAYPWARFQVVDLRWGITTEQAHANETLRICLHEIDDCDIFVGFYGNRYGTSHKMNNSHTAWVYEAFRVASGDFPWVLDWYCHARMHALCVCVFVCVCVCLCVCVCVY